jgi:hypothetical protein
MHLPAMTCNVLKLQAAAEATHGQWFLSTVVTL